MILMRTRHRTSRHFPSLESMPEVGDYYIGAERMFPRGDEMVTCHVVVWSYDTSGNIMGMAHSNPILATRMYQVEFAAGEVTELTTNVIAESMYAHFDADRNEYLLLDVLINYCKDNKAIFLTDEQTTV